MKTYSAGLLNNVVTSYDKTKTTILGKVAQKTINSKSVLGPPLSKFIDVYTDTLSTVIPGMMFLSPNSRLYVLLSAPATGAANTIAVYNFNTDTGATSYIGKIAFNIAAPATITARGFKVDDSNTSNIKIFIGYVSTTTTTGGCLMLNKVALSDFAPVGYPTLYSAISNDVKAVYSLQSPVEVGGQNLMTTVAGVSLPFNSANSAINTKVFVHNGIAATHQYYAFDYSSGPTLASLGTSTVTSANTTGVSATFTMTGNTLAVNDPVVITSNAPAGYTVSTNTAAQTVYYVVATNFVSGSTFSLSATLGGAIINATTAVSGTTFVRAIGQTTNQFYGKTSNLPALAGTLLLTNSENYAVPSHTANSGTDCVYFASTTTQYLGRYTDLYSSQTGTLNGTINVTGLSSTAGLNVGQTVSGAGIPVNTTIATIVSSTAITLSQAATTSGATTLVFGASLWPNLVNSNVLGTGLDYMAITPVNAVYSTQCDSSIMAINGIYCITKKFVNSVVQSSIGQPSQIWLEGQSHPTDQFSVSTLAGLETHMGWVLASSTAVGQRGIVAMHLLSDSVFDNSSIITPVMAKVNASLIDITTLEQLFDATGSCVFQYRSAATASDSIFNSASGGWTTIATASDLSGIVIGNYVQFKIQFALSISPSSYYPSVTTPSQVQDLLVTTLSNTEISDYWDYSYDASTTTIPTRVGFRLRQAYNVSVPTLYFRAYDSSNNLITTADTSTNATNFQYSTDGGLNWNPLGTIPNTVGTLIRYSYTTPPGVDIFVSIRES